MIMNTLYLVINTTVIVFISYLVGSIPTSIIVGKAVKGIDIRNYGSGNAGGTNSFRVMGWKAGILVVSVDIFKGFAAAAWLSRINLFGTVSESGMLVPILAGAAVALGHCFTIFAGFKGGKGIATSAGVLLALFPLPLMVSVIAFTLVLITSGYVSLGSLVAAAVFPVTMLIFYLSTPGYTGSSALVFSFVLSAFIFYTHRSNIKRLIAGKENRFEKVRIFAKKS
jgi:glycerol-3-phosphate acyltransferase PlsY